MDKELIAPCGMNCGVCYAYLREKNKCPGCRGPDDDKSISCIRCKIKNCKEIKRKKLKFCFECASVPCEPLKRLDKRYKGKYHMSMVENLDFIKDKGIKKFLKWQGKKYSCACGGTICTHNGKCNDCGAIKELD